MNDNEMNLLFKKAWGTITEEDFQNQFTKKLNSDYVVSELDNIIEEKSRDKLEAILSYMYLIEEVSLLCHYYQKLLLEDWHIEHENIALSLQFKTKCPDSVDYLVKAMNLHHEYLIKSGDDDAFIRKCMYAIADLGTDYSKEKLQELSSSSDEVIKGYAKYQIEKSKGSDSIDITE